MSELRKPVDEGKLAASSIAADPAFAALESSGVPLVVAAGDPPRVVHVNEAALLRFGADLDGLTRDLFESDEPGARRLRELAASMRESEGPKLERLRLRLGEAAQATVTLCRRLPADGRSFFVCAALGTLPAPAESSAANGAVRPASLRRARFLWRTDADGRFAETGPALSEAVGREYSNLAGRAFTELARGWRLDSSGRLGEALNARRSWSGVEVSWPMETGNARVPIALGAFPIFGDAGEFRGFRGYGVIRLDRVEKDTPSPSSAKIVPLRTPPRAGASAAGGQPRAPEESLSQSEKTAFDEIARALGAVRDQGPAAGAGAHASMSAPASETPRTAETALQARAREILDRLPVGVLVAREGRILLANRTLLQLLGYQDAAALQSDGLRRVFPGVRLAELATKARADIVEARAQDGETICLYAHFQNIDWEGGGALLVTLRKRRPPSARANVLHVAAELTQLARARRDAEELWSVLETTGAAVAILDGDGAIERATRAFASVFGCEPATLPGRPLADLFAQEDGGAAASHLRRFLLGEAGVQEIEAKGKARNGAVIPLHLALDRLGPPPRGKLCARLNGIAPASDAIAFEAERASAAKSDLLAKVSHEIRTPLSAMLGFVEIMRDERLGPIGNERYKTYLKDIHASGAHVLALANDLLDLSKIEAGKMELEIERLDLNAAVGECVSIMQAQADNARVILRMALSDNLPPVAADARSLRQILLNLLSNAIKFTDPGGQVIVSSARNEAGLPVFRIKDTGAGMSNEEMETALQPYRRLAASLAKSAGTGLGLPLTKSMVEANRASFSIKSRKGEGTLIEVTFPEPEAQAGQETC